MFTGLIEAVGQLSQRTTVTGGARLRIVTPLARELALGDSLAVNGVCLTVTSLLDGEVAADVGPETLRVTTLGALMKAAWSTLSGLFGPTAGSAGISCKVTWMLLAGWKSFDRKPIFTG